MRARKYRVASNDTVLSATRYGPYARLSRIISCRYTVVITDFSVSPYIKAEHERAALGLSVTAHSGQILNRVGSQKFNDFFHENTSKVFAA